MWNIPGAYVRWNETILDAARRVAKEEVGTELESIRLLGVREWMDHPEGRPISMFYMAFSTGKIKEDATRRFFGANELPNNYPLLQREFSENFLMAESRLFRE